MGVAISGSFMTSVTLQNEARPSQLSLRCYQPTRSTKANREKVQIPKGFGLRCQTPYFFFGFPAWLKAQPACKTELGHAVYPTSPQESAHRLNSPNKCEPEPHCTARLGGKGRRHVCEGARLFAASFNVQVSMCNMPKFSLVSIREVTLVAYTRG